MASTYEGVYHPLPPDPYDPAGDMSSLASSLSGHVIVPVPNIAARDALAAQVSPTPSKPLFVDRADAAPGVGIERTEDGTNWTVMWESPADPMNAGGSLQRSDGQMVLNSGSTDLLATGLNGRPTSAVSVWSGSGIHHSQPGLWWVQATLRTSVTGARWARIDPASIKADMVALGSTSADDTAPSGFGTASWSGFFYCPSGPGIRFSANSDAAGSIRAGSSVSLVWMRP